MFPATERQASRALKNRVTGFGWRRLLFREREKMEIQKKRENKEELTEFLVMKRVNWLI